MKNAATLLYDAALPLLTPEQEKTLAASIRDNYIALKGLARSPVQDQQYRKGCRDRETFIRSNIRLVGPQVRKKITQHFCQADLMAYGIVGLIEAVDLFDLSKGCKFSTHAHWWILKHLSIAVNDREPTVRLPDQMQRYVRKLERVERSLNMVGKTLKQLHEVAGWTEREMRSHGLEGKNAESIHEAANWSDERFENVKKARSNHMCYSSDVVLPGTEITLIDAIEDKKTIDNDELSDLATAITQLNATDRALIKGYFGLDNYQFVGSGKPLEQALVQLRVIMGAPATLDKVRRRPRSEYKRTYTNDFIVLSRSFPVRRGRPLKHWGSLGGDRQWCLWDIA